MTMKSMPVFRIINTIVTCGFSFFRYLRGAGLATGAGTIILSSHTGTNYGRRDVRTAATLVSLRRLDLIKHLEMFVGSLVSLISPDTSFVGCFAQEGPSVAGISQGYRNRISFSRFAGRHTSGYRLLSRESVSALLEDNGLVIIDMKEINGLTYFHSRKRQSPDYPGWQNRTDNF